MSERGPAVRPATPADAKEIAHVHVGTWRTAYRGIVPQVHLDGMSVDRSMRKWEESLLHPQPQTSFVLVAEQGGEIVGFVKAGAERGDDPQHRGEVHAIYVLAEHQ